jgi:hypothetical protein
MRLGVAGRGVIGGRGGVSGCRIATVIDAVAGGKAQLCCRTPSCYLLIEYAG